MIPGLVLVLVLVALFYNNHWVSFMAIIFAAFVAYPDVMGDVAHVFIQHLNGITK